MKKSISLAEAILTDEIATITGDLGHRLNVILDSMTDHDCKPLPNVDANLVEELKDIAYKLYQLNENVLPEAAEDLVETIKAGL